MKRTFLFLGVLVATVACGSSGSPGDGAESSPSPSATPSFSATPSPSETEPPEPSPSPSPVSPIPDGRYTTTVTDASDAFFEEAPARVVLTLDAGEYALQENGIQFESGVYWGSGRHIELDAGVGPCAGAESFHEYDWTLRRDVLRFEADGGQVCIGRLILFTRYEWRRV
jgi:hypothetical protein